MLIGAILAWISILPVALQLSSILATSGGQCVPATGAGSTLAGINIALSFIGFLCDACSHCCCKSVKSLSGPSTVVVISQPAHHMAMPVAQQAPAQGASLWRVNTDGKEKCECCRCAAAGRRARGWRRTAAHSPLSTHCTHTRTHIACRVRE